MNLDNLFDEIEVTSGTNNDPFVALAVPLPTAMVTSEDASKALLGRVFEALNLDKSDPRLRECIVSVKTGRGLASCDAFTALVAEWISGSKTTVADNSKISGPGRPTLARYAADSGVRAKVEFI